MGTKGKGLGIFLSREWRSIRGLGEQLFLQHFVVIQLEKVVTLSEKAQVLFKYISL